MATLFGKPRAQVVKHPGSFRAAADRAGMSTHQLAERDKSMNSPMGRKARLALAFETMRSSK